LVVKIDGQVVNPRSGPPKWGSHTAVVRNAFDLRYDVTNLVKGRDKVTVEIGVTTFVGSWSISAEFNGVLGDYTPVPTPGGETPIPNTWLAAGGGIACIGLAWYLRSKELE